MKKNLKIETKSKNYNIQISDEPIEISGHPCPPHFPCEDNQ